MADNETIARWLGPFMEASSIGAQVANGVLSVIEGRVVMASPGRRWEDWQPDTDIALWHGDGLLAEIEKRKLAERFVDAVYDVTEGALSHFSSNPTDKWAFLRIAPIQLTAALVKVIDETDTGR